MMNHSNVTLNNTLLDPFLLCHQSNTIPFSVFLWVVTIIIFGIVGMAIVEKSRKKYALIWFISSVFSSLVLLGVIFLPNLVNSLIKGIWDTMS